MRVVAGTAGGLRLVAPTGGRVRPTSDRVREAVFGSLDSMGAIDGALVLDLFAGTGALAIEALSRGAERAVLVDEDRGARAAAEQNLSTTSLTERAELVAADALTFLSRLPLPSGGDHRQEGAGARGDEGFDLVLLDPPYDFDAWEGLLERVEERSAPGAVVVIESASVVPVPPSWHVRRDKRYGGTFVRIATLPPAPTTDPGAQR